MNAKQLRKQAFAPNIVVILDDQYHQLTDEVINSKTLNYRYSNWDNPDDRFWTDVSDTNQTKIITKLTNLLDAQVVNDFITHGGEIQIDRQSINKYIH